MRWCLVLDCQRLMLVRAGVLASLGFFVLIMTTRLAGIAVSQMSLHRFPRAHADKPTLQAQHLRTPQREQREGDKAVMEQAGHRARQLYHPACSQVNRCTALIPFLLGFTLDGLAAGRGLWQIRRMTTITVQELHEHPVSGCAKNVKCRSLMRARSSQRRHDEPRRLISRQTAISGIAGPTPKKPLATSPETLWRLPAQA